MYLKYFTRNYFNPYKKLKPYKIIHASILEDRILWFSLFLSENKSLKDSFHGSLEMLIRMCEDNCLLYNNLQMVMSTRLANKHIEEVNRILSEREGKLLDELEANREKIRDFIKRRDKNKTFYDFFSSQEYIDKVSFAVAINGGMNSIDAKDFYIIPDKLY